MFLFLPNFIVRIVRCNILVVLFLPNFIVIIVRCNILVVHYINKDNVFNNKTSILASFDLILGGLKA